MRGEGSCTVGGRLKRRSYRSSGPRWDADPGGIKGCSAKPVQAMGPCVWMGVGSGLVCQAMPKAAQPAVPPATAAKPATREPQPPGVLRLVVRTRITSQNPPPARPLSRRPRPSPLGLMDTINSTQRSGGVRALYRGYGVSATAIGAYKALYFGLYDTACAAMEQVGACTALGDAGPAKPGSLKPARRTPSGLDGPCVPCRLSLPNHAVSSRPRPPTAPRVTAPRRPARRRA